MEVQCSEDIFGCPHFFPLEPFEENVSPDSPPRYGNNTLNETHFSNNGDITEDEGVEISVYDHSDCENDDPVANNLDYRAKKGHASKDFIHEKQGPVAYTKKKEEYDYDFDSLDSTKRISIKRKIVYFLLVGLLSTILFATVLSWKEYDSTTISSIQGISEKKADSSDSSFSDDATSSTLSPTTIDRTSVTSAPITLDKTSVTSAPITIDKSVVTSTPIASSSPSEAPVPDYICLHGDARRSDKLAHKEVLHKGKFICSPNGRYRMGLKKNGDLIWRDDEEGETKRMASGGHHFILTEKGVFILYGDESNKNILWTVGPTGKDIQPNSYCLDQYECPYLHLQNGGVAVLNWIDDAGSWNKLGIQQAYALNWNKITIVEDSRYRCLDNIVSHGVSFQRGDFICSSSARYVFGLDLSGNFVHKDLDRNETVFLMISGDDQKGDRITFTSNSTFIMYNNNIVEWSLESKERVDLSPMCLPPYDCPYLHIRNDGVVVLDWIDNDGWWISRKIQKMFDLNW